VIINADDLGRTHGINEGIFQAHQRGLVSSATLMVGYAPAADAAARLGEFPELGIGLHVALTGQAPILSAETVSSLVDAAGQFPAKPEGYESMDLDPAQVVAEVRAQFERFQHLTGRLPTHLDSHHHSHRHPTICEALITVAGEDGLPVRNTSAAVGEALRRASTPSSDFFVERFFGDEASLPVLLEILAAVGDGVTEVMCHPAEVDQELLRTSSYAEDRQRELAVLTHPDARRALAEHNLDLVHFGSACGS
jgi:predicted glycoside hydrolase/deacetylase ChbG (UPF0249 family)